MSLIDVGLTKRCHTQRFSEKPSVATRNSISGEV
jgi:hypothetical protein